MREFATYGQPLRWLVHFRYAEDVVRHGSGTGGVDEREELKRVKREVGMAAARPKKLPWARRCLAVEALRHDFTPTRFVYRRELVAGRG